MARRRHTTRHGFGGASSGGLVNVVLKGIGAGSIAGLFVGDNALIRGAAGFFATKKLEGGIAAAGLPMLKNALSNGGNPLSASTTTTDW
jgi:hypothetical protein